MDHSISQLSIEFASRYLINLISLLILLRFIYYRSSDQKEILGGFLLFGNGVFFVTSILHDVEMSMGFAFGLFAIFSMLRYRTESLSIREMSYLFVVITLSLMSAVSTLSLLELSLINGFVCFFAIACESAILAQNVEEKNVQYDNVKLISPECRNELHKDLSKRLGVEVIRVQVGEVDFLRDSAKLRVYCKDLEPQSESTLVAKAN